MRAIVFEAVSLRQLVFHLSADHPLAGRGLQQFQLRLIISRADVLDIPRPAVDE
jgi:hypothetical protein